MDLRPDADFQAFLREGRFMLLRSRRSGACFFYPRVIEPGTGSADLEWVEAGGLGTVYSITVIRPKPPDAAYNVALVDLDEGPRLMTRVEAEDPARVAIGARVKARITDEAGQPFVVFDPVET